MAYYYYWVWMLGSLEDSINVLEGFWKGYGTRSSCELSAAVGATLLRRCGMNCKAMQDVTASRRWLLEDLCACPVLSARPATVYSGWERGRGAERSRVAAAASKTTGRRES
jgi:hypothetical protein